MGGAPRLLLLLLSTPLPPRHCFPLFLLRHRRRLSSLSLSFRRRTNSQSLASNSPLRRLGSFTADSVVSVSEEFFPEPTAASPVFPTELAPEWSSFFSNLSASGYFARKEGGGTFHIAEDELAEGVASSEELVRSVRACLAFAHDRPYLLREVDRRDVEVVIRSGLPNLFKSGEVSSRRISLFLNEEDAAVSNGDTAQTVDLMKCILSSTILAHGRSFNQELASSVQNLLSQMAKLSCSAPGLSYADNVNHQYPEGYGISQRPRGQNTEMKRGDWICSRCNFMNFARNVKCLECEEVRPKRQLTGGEWECPQCDFFNYGKNVSCLRCDCKRPGGIQTPLQSRLLASLGVGNDVNQAKIQRTLAVTDEKAQKCFSKISKLDSPSDKEEAIEDKDFPEIMPLRKGVNRFAIGTRKTTLEGRSEKAQLPSSSSVNDQKSSGKIDEILESAFGQKSIGGSARGKSPAYVPFVPLPADMFAKKPVTAESSITNNDKPPCPTSWKEASVSSGSIANNESAAVGSPLHGQGSSENGGYGTAEGEEESDRWFKKILDLNNARDLSSSSISSENFPETMPMHKGENRFVIGRMKDRSMSSPLYKRRAPLEQAGNSNFVPFVPFPPGYFAKKDNQQPEGEDLDSSTTPASSETNSMSGSPVKVTGKEIDFSTRTYGNNVQRMDNPVQHGLNVKYKAAKDKTTMQDMDKLSKSGGDIGNARFNGRTSGNEVMSAPTFSEQASDGVKARERCTGKSLEGSLVTEGPDRLDMSEEAKAERWFRRVAQIKDISELSQIPDEDFPSIMPMRKGVNRFVVSKRKTPLERRLTSSQYRRNLPVIHSDPMIKPNEDDS